MSRKGQEVSGNGSRADRKASTADCLSVYKLAACAWPSRAAILETTSVVDKLEIALLATSVESSAISFLGRQGAPTSLPANRTHPAALIPRSPTVVRRERCSAYRLLSSFYWFRKSS